VRVSRLALVVVVVGGAVPASLSEAGDGWDRNQPGLGGVGSGGRRTPGGSGGGDRGGALSRAFGWFLPRSSTSSSQGKARELDVGAQVFVFPDTREQGCD
jgi:hypothetical protein